MNAIEKLRDAAADLEQSRETVHALVLEARSPDLFGRRHSLREVANAAGLAPETVRKLERTPVGEW